MTGNEKGADEVKLKHTCSVTWSFIACTASFVTKSAICGDISLCKSRSFADVSRELSVAPHLLFTVVPFNLILFFSLMAKLCVLELWLTQKVLCRVLSRRNSKLVWAAPERRS